MNAASKPLAWIMVKEAIVKPSKDKKLNPAGDPAKEKQAPPGTKMIRLDDLIPKQDVKGGSRVFFGGKHLKSTENKPRK
jgi:hypothetical protein